MSDSDDDMAQLQACAAILRAELAASSDALQTSLKPLNLLNAARQSLTEKASASIDPAITTALSAHGTSILVLGVAALGFGMGRRAVAKPRTPSHARAAASDGEGPHRTADLLALVRETKSLVSLLAMVLVPGLKRDDDTPRPEP